MSKIEVNQVSSQCGSTLTIGQSGDTVQLASGASQTGFGRTGTVDWDTTKKTASFTAVNGTGYFIDTSSGAITATLPASPSAGDIVAFKDYSGNFSTNNVTVGRNSSNIDGVATDPTLSEDNLAVSFVYIDSTQGWKAINSDAATYGALFISATGGTIVTSGDFKTHIFTGPGTFTVSCAGNSAGSNGVEYMVVAGGGSGGTGCAGGSGGAGGMRLRSVCGGASPRNAPAPLQVCAQAYPITVGGGGSSVTSSPGSSSKIGNNGSNSIFSTITSTGGGGGGAGNPSAPACNPFNGQPGGSGGGGGHSNGPGGTGNTPIVSPPQGNDGGPGIPIGDDSGGGGGGAGTAATTKSPTAAADGGDGTYIPTTFIGPTAPSYGESGPDGRYFAGGGGGSVREPGANPTGSGGLGGGADGTTKSNGNNGSTNMGGGGSGGSKPGSASPNSTTSGTGGSGIVMIRYKFQ